MKTVQVSDIFITSWEEVNFRKLIAILPLLHLVGKKMSKDSLKLFALLSKKKSTLQKLTAAQIVDTYHDIVQFTNLPLIYFKLKSFSVWFTTYYAPDTQMSTSVFAEFMMMDTNLSRYMKTEEDQYLLKIISSLYRPQKWFWFIRKRWDDDNRQKFTDRHYNRFNRLKKLSNGKKLAILQTAIGVRIKVMNMYPNLFPKPLITEEEDNIFTASNIKDSGPMWNNIRMDVAGTPQISGIENVDYTNMYTVLNLLEKMQVDAIERERIMNEAKRSS